MGWPSPFLERIATFESRCILHTFVFRLEMDEEHAHLIPRRNFLETVDSSRRYQLLLAEYVGVIQVKEALVHPHIHHIIS